MDIGDWRLGVGIGIWDWDLGLGLRSEIGVSDVGRDWGLGLLLELSFNLSKSASFSMCVASP